MKLKILNFFLACLMLALLGYAAGNGLNYLTTWFKNKAGQIIALLVFTERALGNNHL